MLLTCLAVAVAVSVVSSEVVNVKDLPRFYEPEASGSFDFDYTNGQTQQAAEKFQTVYTDAVAKLKKYGAELKSSCSATQSVNEFDDAVKSVTGTKCEVSKEDGKAFNGAQENIQAVIDTCVGSVTETDLNTLKTIVTEYLAKIQAIDNTLRLNSEICFSLRVPPSQKCQEAKQRALDRLNDILSLENLNKVKNLAEQATEIAENNLEKCLDDSTKSLKDNINDSINTILECQLKSDGS